MDTQDVQTQEETTESVATESEVLTESESAILELKDQLLRALAENENTRKRGQKDKDDWRS